MLSNHLILCHPLLLLPSVLPSIRIFSKELALPIKWPKYWSFSFSISPYSSGLISFMIDWFEILAVQGILKSLLQHHNLKASILQYSAFFKGQLSHPYMTTGKTLALTIQTFVIKVITILNSFLILVHHIQLVIILWILHVDYPLNLHCNHCLSFQIIPSHS